MTVPSHAVTVNPVGTTRYVAQPKDNSLSSFLIEAFKLLELKFDDYDADKVSTYMSLTLTSCQTCARKQSPELSGLTDKMRHRVRRPKLSTSMSSQTGLR